MRKNGFTIIELIISISILIVLAIVSTTATNTLKNNSYNSKVISDLGTINSALVSFLESSDTLPTPDGNNNNYSSSGIYVHDFESSFGTYGKFKENTLAKMYLDSNPLDPRTNQYYSYGITRESNKFEISGVIYNKESDNYSAKVVGNYNGDEGLYNLIKEYNGNNFVTDKGYNLPYNPYERIFTVTDSYGNSYVEGDTITNNTSDDLELFFSDGSVSVIESGTILTLTESNFHSSTNISSKINIFLQAGTIWTKATRLDKDSSFDVYTSDATASVRGTIFAVSYDGSETTITLQEGSLEVYLNNEIGFYLNTPSYLEDNIEESSEGKVIFTNETGEDKTLIINGSTIFGSTENIDNVNFIIPEVVYISSENSLSNNDYLVEIIEETKNESCYLGGEIIKNGTEVNAYKQNYVTYGENCGATSIRECVEGELIGNNEYKYTTCVEKDANQCFPYNDEGFTGGSVKNQNETDYVYKENDISKSGIKVGELKYKREVKCKENGRGYYLVSQEIDSFACNPTLIKDEINNTCICADGETFDIATGECKISILNGYGCGSCPNGSRRDHHSGWLHIGCEEFCTGVKILGHDVLCSEKDPGRTNRSWSGYLDE